MDDQQHAPATLPLGNIQYRLYSGPGDGLDFMEDLASSGIRSPNCPGRRESLYRLSYPGRILHVHTTIKMYILFVSQFYFRGVYAFLRVTPMKHSLVVCSFITIQILGSRNGADKV